MKDLNLIIYFLFFMKIHVNKNDTRYQSRQSSKRILNDKNPIKKYKTLI